MLFERDRELDALSRAAASALNGNGRTLLFEGPAGIGKTALLERARQDLSAAGMRVLSARGGELERDLGFGLVGQLFGSLVHGVGAANLLTGPAAHASRALGLAPLRGPSDELEAETALTAVHGLYWLTANLSEERPLALLVDDAHWADAASLNFFSHMGLRVEGVAVLLVLGVRSGADAERVVRAVPASQTLRLSPLSLPATSSLVRSVASGADEEVCRACYGATGGNPFFILEQAHSIRHEGLELVPGGAHRLLNWSPQRVTRLVNARLASLGPAPQALARAAAVLGQGAILRHAAAIAGLEVADAADAADDLSAAGILAPSRPLEFVHPIVRAAVYEDFPHAARSRAHAAAASLLAVDRASAERVAVHVTHTEPAGSPDASTWLQAGAREAAERGAPDTAVTYLRRALEEPPPADLENGVLIELATAEGHTFQVGPAMDHLRQAFEAARGRDERLQIAMLFATVAAHNARAGEAIELLVRTKREFADVPQMGVPIDAAIVNTARFEIEARQSTLLIARQLPKLTAGDVPDDPGVFAAMAAEGVMAGDNYEKVAEVAFRGLKLLNQNRRMMGGVIHLVLLRALIVADYLEEAGAALERWLVDGRRRGSALDYFLASLFRAEVMYRRGDVFEAEADSRSVHAFGLEHFWPLGKPVIACHLVTALIERGEIEEAGDLIEAMDLDGAAADQPGLYTSNLLLFARGRLRAAMGDPLAALEDLLECGRREDAWHEPNPTLVPWRSEVAAVYKALGRLDEARAFAFAELELARSFGAPRALGIALRAAASVSEGPPRLRLVQEATDVLSGSPARLEYARALADRGQLELAAGDRTRGRTTLRLALELANTCGASVLEGHVLLALRASGARPRRARLSGPQALTPSERRVSRMAADGLSNREIAEALFVTVRTVEFHLRGAFRKLRIESRRELKPDVLHET